MTRQPSDDAEQPQGKIYAMETRVRWADIDRLGHANNIAYWRWCEDARNQQAVEIGLGQPAPDRPSQIVVASQAEYLAPVSLDNVLTVKRQVVRIGRTSQDATYTILRGEEVVFRASCTIVLFDFQSGAPVPYPDDIRERLLSRDA